MPGYQPRHDTDPIWFNGTQINTLTITSAQAGVRVTAIHGWDDRPDVRDVRELRSGQDGEYADNLYLGGRTITVEGEVYGSTWANLQSRKRTLAATFQPSSDEVLFKVPDPATASPTTVYATTGMTGYERVSCRVIEAIQFGDTLDPCCQTFQVVLRASDPRVYSDVETSTDSGTTGTASRTVTVDQAGTYSTPVTVTVTGTTGTTWSVTEPNSGFSVASSSLALLASETMALDEHDRLATWTSVYYRPRISRSDIVAGWKLDETSGTTADNIEGTSALDLTYNGTFTLNQSGPKSGVPAVVLNGSSGYLSHAYSATLNPSTVSVEGWFKTDATGVLVGSHGSSQLTGWQLKYDASLVALDLQFGNGASSLNTYGYLATQGLTQNEWIHVVATIAPSTVKLYLNGVLAASRGTGGTYSPNTTEVFTLGRINTSASGYLNGSLAGWFMYDSELSAADAADLYASTDATSTSSGYSYLDATSTQWSDLTTASSTYTLASSGLTTGSKLNVTYRDARL